MKELLPAMAIPVLRTPRLARTLAHYCDALGFTLAQQVPGVLALVRHGPLCLQLWQSAQSAQPEGCRIVLDGASVDIFDCHRRLAHRARHALDGAPRMRPWGAWEFCLTDGEGSRLVFAQWALTEVGAAGPAQEDDETGRGRRRRRSEGRHDRGGHAPRAS